MGIRFLEKTMLKIIIFTGLTLFVFSSYGLAQNEGDTLWTRVYGDTANQMAYSVVQTSDGGFAVAGYTGGYDTADFWLIKIDPNGDTVWTRTYGTDESEHAESVKQTYDGGFIMAGWVSFIDTFLYYNIYVVRTDAVGDTIWTWKSGGELYAYAYDVEEMPDSGYVIVGKTGGPNFDDYDACLIRLDSNGDSLWTQVYGGPDHQEGYDVELTSDGGYVITGLTGSCPDYDAYLIKADANGDSLWGHTYGDSLIETGYSVKATSDGGYIISGNAESWTPGDLQTYFIKTNSTGDTLWTRIYGGGFPDEAYSICQTFAGNYVAAGSYGLSRDTDVYLLKLDTNGDTLWTRTYGGGGFDAGNSVVQAANGSYLIAGGTDSFGAGQHDVYLLNIAGPEPGSIAGHVSDEIERAPIESVYVSAGPAETWTDYYGNYELGDLMAQSYDVSFSHPDYQDTTVTGVQVTPGNSTALNVLMTTAVGSIAGHVSDEIERAPIESVYVSAGQAETWTDQYGNYELRDMLAQSYDVSFSHPDYQDTTVTGVQVTPGNSTALNVLMTAASGCDYVVGDVNGSDSYNGLDVTYGVAFFKGGPDPMCPLGSCPIAPCDAFFYCGDVNGSCSYNGLDITYGVAYFKGGPSPVPCSDCPPPEALAISQD